MNAKLVSVVIPSYNHREYVERAIQSVMKQTYPHIELIVIDDGSRDGSVEIIERLAIKHGFKYVSQSNAGICKTLNRGVFEFSTGQYIAIVASDDLWRHDKIELQMRALENNPGSEFCFTQAVEFEDERYPHQGRIFPKKPMSGRVLTNVFFRQHVPAGSILFSRALFDRLGGFDESLKEEDWDFVIRSASETILTAVSEPLFYYRSHASNTMKTRSRSAIFQQKAKLLSKNMHLVSPWLWLAVIVTHFMFDIVFSAVRTKFSR